MKNLFIIRALPGAGKSTIADVIASASPGKSLVATTDDYPGLYSHTDDGIKFHGGDKVGSSDLPLIVVAHLANQDLVKNAMTNSVETIVVPNTNVCRWEFQTYLELGEFFGYRINVISLFDGGCTDEELFLRNTHGVPLEAIEAMRERFEHDWKNADPRPPYERG